jgi:hyperosmotically inducible periplasmic protein
MTMRTSFSAAVLAFAVLINSGCSTTRGQENVGTNISDKLITSTIKARNTERKDLALTHISVETLYGVVLLSGVAKTPQEKITAQEIAQQVEGVKAVHNEIVVETDTGKTPQEQTAPDARI